MGLLGARRSLSVASGSTSARAATEGRLWSTGRQDAFTNHTGVRSDIWRAGLRVYDP